MKQFDTDSYPKEIIEATDSEPDYSEFVNFCREQQRGLRKQAFKHLDTFLKQTIQWEFEKRLQFVITETTRTNLLASNPQY